MDSTLHEVTSTSVKDKLSRNVKVVDDKVEASKYGDLYVNISDLNGLSDNQFVNKFDLIKEIIFAPFAYIKNVLASTNFLKGFLYQNMISSIGVTLAMIPTQYIHFAWIGLIASVFYKSENETECNIKIADRIMLFAVIILIHFIILYHIF